MNKIKEIYANLKLRIAPKLVLIDTKVTTFIPNPKYRKITYIAISSLFGFMFLIIILGLIFSPLKNNNDQKGLTLKKPEIVTTSPLPEAELSEIQRKILDLEAKIKDLKFPESILNIPVVERDIEI